MLDELRQEMRGCRDLDAVCKSFAEAAIKPLVYGQGIRRNPFTGGLFLRPHDTIAIEIKKAIPRLRALVYFDQSGPYRAPFPINYAEREKLKLSGDPELRLWAMFANSLECHDYDYAHHPFFAHYAGEVVWSDVGYWFSLNPEIIRRYPNPMTKVLNPMTKIWDPTRAQAP